MPPAILSACVLACFAIATSAAERPEGAASSESAGFSNGALSFQIEKDARLIGIRRHDEPNFIAEKPSVPLWSLEFLPPGAEKPVIVTPDRKTSFKVVERGDIRTLEATTEKDGRQVTVSASLGKDSLFIRWRIQVDLPKGERLWSVTFPQIAVAAPDADPAQNEMVVPYRRGQLRVFGKGAPRGDGELPYPGPSAKFQFLAAYGEQSRRGLYFAAEDGAGYSKLFITRNYPEANSVVFAVKHLPANRGAGIQHYELPYDVVTGPFTGDWWDAARIYRDWWVKQEWASRGLLADRRDIPEWLERAPFATRPSTTKAGRTVANNVAGLTALSEAFEGHPFFGIWYGAPEMPGGNTRLDEGHGHFLPPRDGLLEAVREARKRGIHLQEYIQSVIYDSNVPDPDEAAAEKAVTRDEKGQPVPYGGGLGKNLQAMCRATDWWQTRLVALSRRAVAEWGFDGVYLDSFGKGAPECFAPDHGHPIGGGNTVVAGQRAMAKRIRDAIRAVNPEAIMSGEDPIEAFRDLLDVNLYSVNVMPNYVPIYRTVWGDYSLGHGRVLSPGPALLPELATLFLEGTIAGRIYCDSPKVFLLQPENANELAFLKSMAAYTDHGLEYLRLGEYLHPLNLTTSAAAVEFQDSVEHQKVRLPGVLHSVTRSHRDGSVAIVLVNIGAEAQTVEVPIDPALRGGSLVERQATLSRIKETGEKTQLWTGRNQSKQSITLVPREIAFLVLE